MYGNAMLGVGEADALMVDHYSADVQEPKLLSFDMDKDSKLLRLHFDEPVNVSSLKTSGITLQGFSSRLNLPHMTLTSASTASVVNSTYRTSVTIFLGSTDFTYLQLQRPRMGEQQANTYMTMMGAVVSDLSEQANNNFAIPDGRGIQVGPVLVYFTLNMNSGTMILTFSRPINSQSFDMTGLTLMNSGGFSYYRLTGNGLGAYHYTEADGLRLVVGLTDTDLNAIKVFGDLAITQSSSLLVVSYITIQDTQDLRQC